MSRQTCNWVVCSWIALWVCLSVTIIIVNKHILFYTDFKYPFALALWHMLLASCVSKGCMWGEYRLDVWVSFNAIDSIFN
jgi:hypothetical protein